LLIYYRVLISKKGVFMLSSGSGRSVRRKASSERVSLTDSLYSEIHERIITWQIAPDEILGEARLAEEYNVSKTPIREALALLSQEGLVEVLPRVGYRVTSVGIGDVHEIYDLRLLLEPEAVGLAAKRATNDEVLALLEANREWLKNLAQEDSLSSVEYLRFHDSFHKGIASLSGNGRLARFIDALLRDSARIRMSDPLMSSRGFDEDTELPEQVAEALLDRNEQRARKLLHEHIANSKERVLSQLIHPTAQQHGVSLKRQ
jgi:DNA-binding GntR family transcriptional regulator